MLIKMLPDKFYKKYFLSRFVYDKSRDAVWKSIAKYLQRYIDPNFKVLDVGAGYCNFINSISAKEKHALDFFSDLRKCADKGVITHKSSSCDMKGLKQAYFDVIFASNFFEHLTKKDINLTMKEIRRVLKKNGILIVIQPNYKYCYKEYFDDYTHETVLSDTSLCDLLRNFGFKIEKCVPRFLPFSIKSKLPKLNFLVDMYLSLPYRPLAKQMLVVARRL